MALWVNITTALGACMHKPCLLGGGVAIYASSAAEVANPGRARLAVIGVRRIVKTCPRRWWWRGRWWRGRGWGGRWRHGWWWAG